VTGSSFASRDVIEIKNAPNLKWDMSPTLDETQVAARICDLRELNDPALLYAHGSIPQYP
jgi:hypothetical protein